MESQEIINLYINELFQTKKINVDSTTVGELKKILLKKFKIKPIVGLGLRIIVNGRLLIDESKTLKEYDYDPVNDKIVLIATTSMPESNNNAKHIFNQIETLGENLLFSDIEELTLSEHDIKRMEKLLKNMKLDESTTSFFKLTNKLNKKLERNNYIFTLEEIEENSEFN